MKQLFPCRSEFSAQKTFSTLSSPSNHDRNALEKQTRDRFFCDDKNEFNTSFSDREAIRERE
jgi:hypothetical protein